jgi:acetyl esterase
MKLRNHSHREPDHSLLDDQSRSLIEAMRAAEAPSYTQLSPRAIRQGHEDYFFPLSLPERDLADRTEQHIADPAGGQLRLWIYQPKSPRAAPLPCMVFYHGGGMMVGSVELYDSICHRLCQQSGAVIVSTDYRLSPEHKFPAAHQDALAALHWTADHASALGIDAERLAVGGDSGGGLLAAAMSQLSRDGRAPALAFQMLIYPFLGRRRDYPSYREFSEGFFGSARQLAWFIASYMSYPDDLDDPQLCPLVAPRFDGLPPTFVLTAGFDMLRDEAEHYAAMLRQAGVPVVLSRYESTFHPFLNAAGYLDVGRAAIDECAERLRSGLIPSR